MVGKFCDQASLLFLMGLILIHAIVAVPVTQEDDREADLEPQSQHLRHPFLAGALVGAAYAHRHQGKFCFYPHLI